MNKDLKVNELINIELNEPLSPLNKPNIDDNDAD